MAENKQTWNDFKRVGKTPTYINPHGKTEDELWEEWKKRNYKSRIETTLSWEMN